MLSQKMCYPDYQHHRPPRSNRFGDIQQRLEGISPKTLADVLKGLQKENLIHRESFAEIPPRVEYSLTEDGRKLCEAVRPLIHWAEERVMTNHHSSHGTCHADTGIVQHSARKRKA